MVKLSRSPLLSLPLCLILVARPQTVLAQAPLSTTLVEVSVRQVRIAFPPDSNRRWGWPAGEQIGGRYEWSALVGGMDGPTWISLDVYHRDSLPRNYSSLEELVAAGRAQLCVVRGMIRGPCDESPLVRATVEGHRVVLTVADSVVIRELFGTRPESLRVMHQRPESKTYAMQSVPVRYVAPLIPPPDSALLAEAARRRRSYEASITTIDRTIRGGEDPWDLEDIWLAVGDSIRLDVRERRCRLDYCSSLGWPAGDSGWAVKNSRIVSLRPTCGPVCAMAYGRRVGKTTISVRGLHGRSDSAVSRRPPPRRIERRITVGRPVARIRIVPRPDTVIVGQPQSFGARAYDRHGKQVPDVPIKILVQTDSIGRQGMLATQPTPVEFRTPGRRLVIASFRGLADTLAVIVLQGRASEES